MQTCLPAYPNQKERQRGMRKVKWTWKLAIGTTALLTILQVAEQKNIVHLGIEETLWQTGEWLKTPELPVAADQLIPVTADQQADREFIYTSYQPFEEGLLLRVEEIQPVVAKTSGMVLFTGDKRKTGKTMTVAYDSGDTVTYGFLEGFDMLPYTRFQAGDSLGTSQSDLFYIQHENDSRVLDPESLLMWLFM